MKNIESRFNNAKQVAGEVLSSGYAKAGAGAGVLMASMPSWALDATQNTQIADGYTATGVTVTTIIGGLLTVGLIITGFSIVWSLVRK